MLRALDIFTEMGRTDFVSIADRLNQHPDGEVAAAALRARTAVLPAKELLLERLGDRSQQVSVTALIALMARGWIEPAEAEPRLAAALADKSWETAAELARAIAKVAPKRGTFQEMEDRFDDLLVELDQLAPRPQRRPRPRPPRSPLERRTRHLRFPMERRTSAFVSRWPAR